MQMRIITIFSTLAVMAAGFLLWQGYAYNQNSLPEGKPPPDAADNGLPLAGANAPAFGKAPPEPPAAAQSSREEKRFNRYDRDRDGLISRLELMSSRTKAFKNLDKDGNNLLSFEEWAVATSDRFTNADSDKNMLLTRKEFATTRPKTSKKPACKC
ncbi:hypothetical protein LPB140_07940 [Sphingorhabdus lutea]|uniref:EF-hand domain-containing protein n=1 Tax=Sphingorhabdus lutea TaxID=1913578 RepID=A0A1L3JC75_9SPHN|nr:EF-hand domain-containing protein [Sphingorhabdus lutea]APG62730.1 hypothetical protein LPB140_07940 [Sphingorhabdus lutea]